MAVGVEHLQWGAQEMTTQMAGTAVNLPDLPELPQSEKIERLP